VARGAPIEGIHNVGLLEVAEADPVWRPDSFHFLAHHPLETAIMVSVDTFIEKISITWEMELLLKHLSGFTLAEEARNTERHRANWDSDQRLRYSKVNFVSAGKLSTPESQDTNQRDNESALAHMSLDSPTQPEIEVQVEVAAEVEVEEETELFDDTKLTSIASRDQPESSTTIPSNFFIDTHGDGAIKTGLPPPQVRSPSPSLRTLVKRLYYLLEETTRERDLQDIPDALGQLQIPSTPKSRLLSRRSMSRRSY
jgi:hypothetical protein